MNDKDVIKKRALKKLESYVREEVKRLHDGALSLDFFEFKPTSDLFTKEEMVEIRSITERFESHDGIKKYCKLNDIEI